MRIICEGRKNCRFTRFRTVDSRARLASISFFEMEPYDNSFDALYNYNFFYCSFIYIMLEGHGQPLITPVILKLHCHLHDQVITIVQQLTAYQEVVVQQLAVGLI